MPTYLFTYLLLLPLLLLLFLLFAWKVKSRLNIWTRKTAPLPLPFFNCLISGYSRHLFVCRRYTFCMYPLSSHIQFIRPSYWLIKQKKKEPRLSGSNKSSISFQILHIKKIGIDDEAFIFALGGVHPNYRSDDTHKLYATGRPIIFTLGKSKSWYKKSKAFGFQTYHFIPNAPPTIANNHSIIRILFLFPFHALWKILIR